MLKFRCNRLQVNDIIFGSEKEMHFKVAFKNYQSQSKYKIQMQILIKRQGIKH